MTSVSYDFGLNSRSQPTESDTIADKLNKLESALLAIDESK